MTKTNKKQKNLANPVELKEHLSHRIGNVGEVQIYPVYSLGDEFTFQGLDVKVVEVLSGRLHLKSKQAPFNSFIVTDEYLLASQDALITALDKAVEGFGAEDLAKVIVQDTVSLDAPSVGLEVIEDYDAPDLMVREDKSASI